MRAWCGTIEPLAPGWAGLVLLARAAPYAKHRDNYSALFDIETMEPLVAGPPFVQALEELVAAAKLGPGRSVQLRSGGGPGGVLAWRVRHGPDLAHGGERGERGEGRGEREDRAGRFSEQPRTFPIRLIRKFASDLSNCPARGACSTSAGTCGTPGPTTKIRGCRCWRSPAGWAWSTRNRPMPTPRSNCCFGSPTAA